MRIDKLLCTAVLATALGVLGCSDDNGGGMAGSGGSGATGATGGAAGSAGMGGGAGSAGVTSTCDAICAGSCRLFNIDPADEFCQLDCRTAVSSYATDDCGSLMQAFVECLGPECASGTCPDEREAWATCATEAQN